MRLPLRQVHLTHFFDFDMNYLYVYIVLIGLVMVLYIKRQQRLQGLHRAQLDDAIQAGLLEPPSLHPVVDPTLCMGRCLRKSLS
jgi:hypothetical protein